MKVWTDAVILGSMINFSVASNALEIGAGTGVISLMLAQRFPDLTISAIEIDNPSAEDCQENFNRSPWKERLTLKRGDFLSTLWEDKFDLIFSNPPFYRDSLINADARKARARHESFLPLGALLKNSEELLSDIGQLWLIIPVESAPEVIHCAKSYGLELTEEITIHGKPGRPVRTVVAFSKVTVNEIETREFTVRDESGNYSEEYKAMTINFHDRPI